MPKNSFTLISDENGKIYLAKIKKYIDIQIDESSIDYQSFINKENTEIRKTILQSYDLFLNGKYKVNINQIAINNVKNLFQ